MAAAQATNWGAIRSAVENGVSYEKAAATFGVRASAIRKRASRNGWVTSVDMRKLVQKGQTPMSHVTKDVTKALAMAAIEESIAEKGAAYERMVADKFTPAVQNATLGVIKTASDLEKVDKIVRKALHLESGDNQVNVAIIPGAWGAMAVKTIDSGNSGAPTFEADATELPNLALVEEPDPGDG